MRYGVQIFRELTIKRQFGLVDMYIQAKHSFAEPKSAFCECFEVFVGFVISFFDRHPPEEATAASLEQNCCIQLKVHLPTTRKCFLLHLLLRGGVRVQTHARAGPFHLSRPSGTWSFGPRAPSRAAARVAAGARSRPRGPRGPRRARAR